MQDLTTLLELPPTATVRELQRNYNKVFGRVKSSKKPLLVLRRGRPEVAIVSLKFLQELSHHLKGNDERVQRKKQDEKKKI